VLSRARLRLYLGRSACRPSRRVDLAPRAPTVINQEYLVKKVSHGDPVRRRSYPFRLVTAFPCCSSRVPGSNFMVLVPRPSRTSIERPVCAFARVQLADLYIPMRDIPGSPLRCWQHRSRAAQYEPEVVEGGGDRSGQFMVERRLSSHAADLRTLRAIPRFFR